MRTIACCIAMLVVLVGVVPDDADAQSRRRECRQSCGAAIDACIAEGGKRRRCKRLTLKRCRKQGVQTCVVTSTTTTLPGGATTTNPGGSTTTTTTPGGTTTTGPVHGCTLANAVDLSGDPTPTVTFVDFDYIPMCARIQAGQSISFEGDFGSHPLVGGRLVAGVGQPDPSSPIGTTDTGTAKVVAFPNAGAFPYYCATHGAFYSMMGAVFVE